MIESSKSWTFDEHLWIARAWRSDAAVLIGPCDYAEAAITAATIGASTPKRAEHTRPPICPARIGLECDCHFEAQR